MISRAEALWIMTTNHEQEVASLRQSAEFGRARGDTAGAERIEEIIRVRAEEYNRRVQHSGLLDADDSAPR